MLVALSIGLWALVVLGRLVQLQVWSRDHYLAQATEQSERTLKLDARRGDIVDRHGRSLAVSVDAESVYALPRRVRAKERTAAQLARALSLEPAARREVLVQLRKDRPFVWVKRKVDPQAARAVRDLQLEGIGLLPENRRYYPKRELASQVLGYVGVDNIGMSGVEYAFDELIRGKAAKVTVHVDARRRPVGHTEKPSTDGHTVVLTLDETVQYLAEKELERSVQETGAQSGTAVVLDPRTGEVLALANRPTFNPNRFAAYPPARWVNRAVADAFEPGSIFKIVTAAAGLQEKVVGPDEIIDCGGGGVEVAGVHISDHAVFHQLAFRDVIARSSDVGVVRVAQRLGRENFHRYVRAFGFGADSGVELPGESPGLLREPARWSALSLASMSFGQEVGVTALQMAAAAAAVANRGQLMRPYIVRRVEDAQGRVVREGRPTAVRRVLEPETVDTLTELLEGVVRQGTGRRAAIPGYRVAGKTGTAQKVDATGKYSMVDHVASFVGFVPSREPALVILVALDTPRGARNQGGDVAAPLFARIAEPVLRYLAVPPDEGDRSLQLVSVSFARLRPAAHHPAPEPLAAAEAAPGLMPDLRGRSAREAALLAARRGLLVELSGSGVVAEQDPPAGAELPRGATCRLRLAREVPAAGGAP
jgi:cell division protein FtsI (penicillin-binding protein 3)